MREAKSGLDDILKKSSQLMARKGFAGTSMRDLAHETGRSLAGLYHYFKDKEELLYLINQRGFSTLLDRASSCLNSGLTPDEKLNQFIDDHLSYFGKHLDEMRVMVTGTQVLDSARGAEIKKLKGEYTEVAQRIVAEFVRAETGVEISGQSLARKTFLLFGMMNWMAGWYRSADHGGIESLSGDVKQIFRSGVLVAARAGAKGQAGEDAKSESLDLADGGRKQIKKPGRKPRRVE